MSERGTAAHREQQDLPPLVAAAVEVALRHGFAFSCLPSHGRLLRLLAEGAGVGVIGETGTGVGVGLAWLASGAHQEARLISVERDAELVELTRAVFCDVPAVTVLHGDWRELRSAGPFDLLALDGGGQGKGGEPPLDPGQWLRGGGLLVLDDFTPMTGWPSRHQGRPSTRYACTACKHPRLLACDIRTEPAAATILASYTG